MRLHRFLIKDELKEGDLILNDKDLVNQLRKVLRLKSGSKLILFDSLGRESLATIKKIDNESVFVEVENLKKDSKENDKNVSLYVSLLKKENFDWVVQKATEVGVNKIIPIITERTIKKGSHLERWKKIIKEAVEQSGRTGLPQIIEPINFKEALVETQKNNEQIVLFDPSGEDDWQTPILFNNLALFVGPEGGFSSKELTEAKACNSMIKSLGNYVLRAETATVVASFIILGNWRKV